MFKTEFVNLHSGEIFCLPTSYSDRVEACVCGQNYCRDRQQEDGTLLFFRVVVDLEKHEVCENCEENCFSCGSCEFVGTDSEEPNYDEIEEDSPFYLSDEQAEKLAGFLLGLN